MSSELYWEQRARLFAAAGDGLAAVCSYGMPAFYNREIHGCQRRALRPWLQVPPGTRVLDVGCGLGRWSCELAARGARVTGVDISPTMIALARQRAAAQWLVQHSRFLLRDAVSLDLHESFDLILGVTILQHILEPDALRAAVLRMRAHLAEGGTLILLEAAPPRVVATCDTQTFRARPRSLYLQLFAECGLRVRAMAGVDPAPFKVWLLPYLPRVPRWARTAVLAIATALAIPIDVLFGRALAHSWHVVFILERVRGPYER
jgi:ubiquinone/menaquinone biosynthesis C-methylase UbiE